METFIAIVLLASGPHSQIRYFGSFPSEDACWKFTQWQAQAANAQHLEYVMKCYPLDQLRYVHPLAFIEEPST